MKRIVIIKEGQKLYSEPYMDDNPEKLYSYSETTKKDYEEFLKVLEKNKIGDNEHEMWYVEEQQND